MNSDSLKYPIGKLEKPETITAEILQDSIANITSFPTLIRAEIKGLKQHQLDTEYRPGGWTIW